MKMVVKQFDELTTQELYDLAQLRSAVFVVEQKSIYLDLDDKDKLCYHLYHVIDNEIISCTRILPKGVSYDTASIGRVCVRSNHRKNNIGKKLISDSIDFIKNEMKEDKITISAQEYLIGFYSSFGFKQVTDVYLEDEIRHVKMVLDFKSM